MSFTIPNFFQSNLRYDIQKLYGHETFTCTLWENRYWWIIKKKFFWPLSLSWLQILGVKLEDVIDRWYNKKNIYQTINSSVAKYSPFFLQIGINTPLTVIEKPLFLTSNQIVAIKKTKQEAFGMIIQQWFYPTIRENMPPSTIILDVTKSDAELFATMSWQAYRFIQKAQKKWITYQYCTSINELDIFYTHWNNIACEKWFSPITKEQFIRLATYLWEKKVGSIVVGKLNDQILSGGVFLEYENMMLYLYGFSSRDLGIRNIGAHHGLMRHMLQIARKKWLKFFDLRWWSPTWEENHPLTSVSKFKESLWWIKIEYYGSFDFVFKRLLYKMFILRQKIKKLKIV